MHHPFARRSGSTKTVVIVLAVTASVGFFVIAACCGLSVWAFRDMSKEVPAAQAAADSFFADLQAGRSDAAYSSATAGFRAGTSPEQFRALTITFPTLRTHTSRSFQLGRVYSGTGGQQATFQVTLQDPAGATNCTVILFKEAGAWKVHHLAMPLPPAPQPK